MGRVGQAAFLFLSLSFSVASRSEGGAGIHFPHTPFSSRPARAKHQYASACFFRAERPKQKFSLHFLFCARRTF